MIGDDVVDLGDPDTDAGRTHPRFDRRVFHPSERAMIARSVQPGWTRWLLWALKESAYKAARKDDPATVFSPVRFVVTLEDEASAIVRIGARCFHATVSAGGGYVHAVARGTGDPPAFTVHAVAGLASGQENPRTAVRRLVGERLAPILGVPPAAPAVHREGRIPVLWLHGRRTDADLSLSHHGRFVSFACQPSPHHGAS